MSNNNNDQRNNTQSIKKEENLMNTQVSLKIIPEQKKGLYDTLILRLEKLIKKYNYITY